MELLSRQNISIFKGVIAYTLAFILIFLLDFESTVEFPITLVSIVLISIAGFPGKTIGAVLSGAILGGLGVLVGAFFFYILAITQSKVAQGFIFLIMLYGFAYFKAISMKYFAFSLLGIVVSFSGIYTSTLLNGFVPGYLISYLIAYGYGFGIVLAVNWFIFPITAERELRESLVASIERISTLAHLIAKSYTLEISVEEKKLRDSLHQQVRSDVGLLNLKLAETSIELNYSRLSMKDYSKIIRLTTSMALGLTTAYSALVAAEKISLPEEKSNFTIHSESFKKLRRAADLIVKDLVMELNPTGAKYSHTIGSRTWADLQEPEGGEEIEGGSGGSESTLEMTEMEREEIRLRLIAQLSREVEGEGEKEKELGLEQGVTKAEVIKEAWKEFEREQHEELRTLLVDGIVDDDVLSLDRPQPSLTDLHNQRMASSGDGKLQERESISNMNETINSTMKNFSFTFGFKSVVESLSELHLLVVPAVGEPRKAKSIHLHLFESIPQASRPQMKLREALAILEGRTYVPIKKSLSRRFADVLILFTNERSLYALKSAVAVTILAVFVLAPSLAPFFVEYSLTGGLITLIVAIAPTLGQTILTFVLQILGTGLGSLYGMVILYIFRDVGGYAFNPYGMSALIFLFAIPMAWILYSKPQFFALSLLAMNAVGTIVITEYIYKVNPTQFRPVFDSPALRCGKALVSMSIALVVAAVFQLLILRHSSRSTLRISLSKITFALSSYNVILQALSVVLIPLEEELTTETNELSPERQEAVDHVVAELVARERQIQLEILGLFPLMAFSAVEFDFGKKFESATYGRIIKSHQLILDRFRECRSALGTTKFDSTVHKSFISLLSPYRLQAKRFSRALFYLTASSLAMKRSLPADLPSIRAIGRAIAHDALILSHRLLKDQDRRHLLNRDFESYWFFLSSYSSVGRELEQLEEDLRVLFQNEDFEKLD